ncbi:MAG: TetR/AcrR family transcriptional regulator [Nannocystales bacterium]
MVREDPGVRRSRLLDAAAALFVRHGFDKTTVSDVATEAGVGKGSVYLHFSSKEALLEALMLRELHALSEAWFEAVMADPRGGTLGGMYKATLQGLHSSPFMSRLMRKDSTLLGRYVRRPGNVFQAASRGHQTRHEVIGMMQRAGAVRDDIDAKVVAHIMNMISYGMVSLDGVVPPEEIPSLEDTLDGIAIIMDRALTPRGVRAASDAGKAVLEEVFTAGRVHLAAMLEAQETP